MNDNFCSICLGAGIVQCIEAPGTKTCPQCQGKVTSLSHEKAKRQNYADVGSPRDLLIELLQEIDAGMKVDAMMIVFANLTNMAAPAIGFATASPSPLITLGMLEEAKASVLDID